MKTGIELITEEREEQLNKHNRSKEHDSEHEEGQLKLAAIFALEPFEDMKGINLYGWDEFTEKVSVKNEVDRLKIAGALIAAEIDRINTK